MHELVTRYCVLKNIKKLYLQILLFFKDINYIIVSKNRSGGIC